MGAERAASVNAPKPDADADPVADPAAVPDPDWDTRPPDAAVEGADREVDVDGVVGVEGVAGVFAEVDVVGELGVKPGVSSGLPPEVPRLLVPVELPTGTLPPVP